MRMASSFFSALAAPVTHPTALDTAMNYFFAGFGRVVPSSSSWSIQPHAIIETRLLETHTHDSVMSAAPRAQDPRTCCVGELRADNQDTFQIRTHSVVGVGVCSRGNLYSQGFVRGT